MKTQTRYRNPFLHLLRYCITAIAFTGSASAAPLLLNPIADAFVTGGSANPSAGSPSLNYGGAGALMVSPAGTTKGEIQTLLKFDLSSAVTSFNTTYGAGNWVVDTITLQLGTNFGTQGGQPNNAIFNTINGGVFKVDWLANDDWIEGTGTPSGGTTDGVTFNMLPSLESGSDRTLGTFSYTPVGNTNPPTVPAATYSLGLDSSFLADVTAGNKVSLRLYAGDTGVGYLFNSRTYGTAANRPVLIVTAIPEPSAAALLLVAAGISGLLVSRRKTKP